jgi:hypothetical protein
MIKENKLSFITEEFYIIFKSNKEPKIWDIFHSIVKWCDSYTNFGLNTLDINKELVHYFLAPCNSYQDVKWIYVSINKPKHRINYEERQIKIFKEMIIKEFNDAKPIFKKKLPKRLIECQARN